MMTLATTNGAPSVSVQTQWDAAAEGWDAQTPAIRAWLREATELMFAMAGVVEGHTVLDLAAGSGDATLDLAERVGPGGRVVATDLSSRSIERLRLNIQRVGARNVEARVADAQEAFPEEDRFDAAVCRLGLMLMPDPARALSATAAALKPGAGLCAMVFAGPEENPCVRTLMAVALRHAGLPPRDPFAPGSLFSLGRPGVAETLFRDAGLRNIVVTRIDAPFRLPTATDYVSFAREAAAPVRAILDRLDPTTRERAWAEIMSELGRFSGPDGWEGPNTLLLATGRR